MQTTECAWEQYYKIDVSRFRNVSQDFRWIIEKLRTENSSFLSQNARLVFVLGGFVPNNGTPSDFISFCQGLHGETPSIDILMDMNVFPFQEAHPEHGLRAKLEDLPLSDESVDLILIDGTADLMPDVSIAEFARRASTVLKRNGAVLIAKSPIGVKPYAERWYPVETYFRETPFFDGLMSPFLKLVAYTRGSRPFGTSTSPHFYTEMLAYSRIDSDFGRVALPQK